MDKNKQLTLTLDLTQTNLVMASLAKMPFETVFELIQVIQSQVNPQLEQK